MPPKKQAANLEDGSAAAEQVEGQKEPEEEGVKRRKLTAEEAAQAFLRESEAQSKEESKEESKDESKEETKEETTQEAQEDSKPPELEASPPGLEASPPGLEASPPGLEASPPEIEVTPEEPMKVEEEEIEVGYQEIEQDAPADSREKLDVPLQFLNADCTANVVPATVGGMLLSFKEGSLQYLLASARGSIGIKSGRYAFEVKVVETVTPAEAPGSAGSRGLPKSLLRVGFSTAHSELILGEGEDSVCFDEHGGFMHNKTRDSTNKVQYTAGASIVVVLNLDSASPNANTMSLFKNGERCYPPQALPENLKGKVLFPTITFKNHLVHTNFSSSPSYPLGFRCRMIEDAAVEDAVVTVEKSTDAAEVVFPVFLPDEGTFDWMDWYSSENPGAFSELSDRAVIDWALKSGIQRQKVAWKGVASNDKPEPNFGIRTIDDGTVKETLASLAHAQRRNCMVVEVKGNLTKEDRIAALKKWGKSTYKRVAQVMMGMPEEAYRKRTHELMIAEKQEKVNKEFEATRAEREQKRITERTVKRARKQAEMVKKQEEELKKKAEEAGKEEGKEEVKDEVKPDVKQEEDLSDDDKMEDEKPEVVTLTPAEKQVHFRKKATQDLAPALMSTVFNKFSLPDTSEGFDEVRYTWSSAEVCEQRLKDWVLERKLTTRVEDINPSEWFKEKWKDWQKDLQLWHLKHVEFKDPAKRHAAKAQSKAGGPLGALCKAPPAQKAEAKAEETAEEPKMEVDDDDDDKDPMQALEEEMDREDMDIFGIIDVCDMDGQGKPLFADFSFEDWALLSLRFELHLLVHAFRADAKDPERTGIHPDHLIFYYNKYFKKALNAKNYGVETVDDIIELVKDTVIQGRTKIIESQVCDDLETNEIFVKLTEEARRDRQRRIDAGDTSCILKFQRPAPAVGAKTKSPAVGSMQPAGASTKAASAASADSSSHVPVTVSPPNSKQGGARPNFGQRPPPQKNWAERLANARAEAAAKMGNSGNAPALAKPVGIVRPNMSNMAALQAMAKAAAAAGGWNGGRFGNNWGGGWRG